METTESALTDSVAALEARLDRLATKEDIAEVKRLIADREATMLGWLIGIVSVTAVTLVAAVARMLI